MRGALVLAMVAGCGEPPYDCSAPRWTLEGRPTAVQGIADGTLIAFFGSPGPTTFGGRAIAAPALVRIAPTGEIAAVVELAHGGYGIAMLADDTGAPIVAWGDPMSELTRYDRDFQQRWASSLPGGFAIAPTGEIAVRDQQTLHYLDLAGAERWAVADSGDTGLSLTAGGDVLELDFTTSQRRRRAAADGAIVETVAFPSLPPNGTSVAVGRDGAIAFIDEPLATVVTGMTADGATRWSVPLHTSTADPVFASDGTLVAVTAIGTQIIRLDGATGAILARHDNCEIDDRLDDTSPIVAASSTGYVLGAAGVLGAYDGP